MYDLIIIGGGPAGAGAAVYAARKKLKTLLITESWGGQSVVSSKIQNWIGTKAVSGFDFAKMLKEHVEVYQDDVTVWEGDLVQRVEKKDGGFVMTTKKDQRAEGKILLVVSGSRHRRLGVSGEDRLDGKGVAWCSICDAPLFNEKVVAVVGGGNAGLEAVIDLNPYATKIYLLQRGGQLRGDEVTQKKVLALSKVTALYNVETQEIVGDQFVSGLRYRDQKTNELKTLEVQGVFVEIGAVPNSEFVKGLVQLNNFGEIVVDPKTQQTSQPGIWAAGDVTDVLYKQNNIAVGDAITAVLNIYAHLIT